MIPPIFWKANSLQPMQQNYAIAYYSLPIWAHKTHLKWLGHWPLDWHKISTLIIQSKQQNFCFCITDGSPNFLVFWLTQLLIPVWAHWISAQNSNHPTTVRPWHFKICRLDPEWFLHIYTHKRHSSRPDVNHKIKSTDFFYFFFIFKDPVICLFLGPQM
jgi:hypothetical protein